MSTDGNKQAIRDMIEEVWRRRRLEALSLFWTEDCVNHADTAPGNEGLDALRRYHEGFDAWFRDFDGVRIEILQQVAEDDLVTTRIRLDADHRATGRRVGFDTIRVDRLLASKIAEHWSVADIAGLQSQLA